MTPIDILSLFTLTVCVGWLLGLILGKAIMKARQKKWDKEEVGRARVFYQRKRTTYK